MFTNRSLKKAYFLCFLNMLMQCYKATIGKIVTKYPQRHESWQHTIFFHDFHFNKDFIKAQHFRLLLFRQHIFFMTKMFSSTWQQSLVSNPFKLFSIISSIILSQMLKLVVKRGSYTRLHRCCEFIPNKLNCFSTDFFIPCNKPSKMML